MARILTRGLTGSAGEIVVQGVGVALARIMRGGRSAASRAIKDLTETFKISAMLVQANGKELIEPIFNTVKGTFLESVKTSVRLIPKKLVFRKSDDIKVSVKKVTVRNKDGRN